MGGGLFRRPFSNLSHSVSTFGVCYRFGQQVAHLHKLLFGDKVNRGCNIKNLPIPILDEEQQRMMERLVDSERYDEIEMMLADIFQL